MRGISCHKTFLHLATYYYQEKKFKMFYVSIANANKGLRLLRLKKKKKNEARFLNNMKCQCSPLLNSLALFELYISETLR